MGNNSDQLNNDNSNIDISKLTWFDKAFLKFGDAFLSIKIQLLIWGNVLFTILLIKGYIKSADFSTIECTIFSVIVGARSLLDRTTIYDIYEKWRTNKNSNNNDNDDSH